MIYCNVNVNVVLSGELLKVLNKFYKRKEMQKLAADQGLDGKLKSATVVEVVEFRFRFVRIE